MFLFRGWLFLIAQLALLTVTSGSVFFPTISRRASDAVEEDRPRGSESRAGRRHSHTGAMSYVTMPRRLPALKIGESIAFELPIGTQADTLICVVRQVTDHPGGRSRSFRGFIPNGEGSDGDCMITCGLLDEAHGRTVSCLGNLRPSYLPRSQYELRPILNSTYHVLKEVSVDIYEDEPDAERVLRSVGATLTRKNLRTDGRTGGATARRLTDSNDIMDIMIVYTPDMKASVGSSAAVELLVMQGITESNDILERSGIHLRLRVVELMEMIDTGYSDPGDLADILYSATYTGGGYSAFDTEQSQRYDVGADALVILADGTDSCGVAWLNGFGTSEFQVSVTAYDCFIGYYSFVHELGHNLGATHDLSVASRGSGEYFYSHGWCWDRTAALDCDDTCRRSVMAYSSCTTGNHSCYSCTRMPYFSNPDVYESGAATGSDGVADNARSLNNASTHAVAVEDSLQLGGLIFSVEPNFAGGASGCFEVAIDGWHIGSGDDVVDVILAGVPVVGIVSQTRDRVVVLADAGPGTAITGDVEVIRSGGGDTTTLKDGFTYQAVDSSYDLLEDFEGTLDRFEQTGEIPFFYVDSSCTSTMCTEGGSASRSGVFAVHDPDGTGREGVFSANFSNNGCMDTVSEISVDYFAFSSSPHCYSFDFLTLQARYSVGGPWSVVATATSTQSSTSDDWLKLNTTATFVASVLYGVRIVVSTYSTHSSCDYWNPVSLDDIRVSYASTCDSCPSSEPTVAPMLVPSTAPTEMPVIAQTEAPTLSSETNASLTLLPTLAPSESPTENPSESPTLRPTGAPTFRRNEAPSLRPTGQPSFSTQTEASIPGSMTMTGVSSDDFDSDYSAAVHESMEVILNNNTDGGASVTITDIEDIAPDVRSRYLLSGGNLIVSYDIIIFLEKYKTGAETVFDAVDEILVDAQASSMLARVINKRLKASKGDSVADVGVATIENCESDVVISTVRTVAPTVAPTVAGDKESYLETYFVAIVVVAAVVAVGCLLIVSACLCSRHRSKISPQSDATRMTTNS